MACLHFQLFFPSNIKCTHKIKKHIFSSAFRRVKAIKLFTTFSREDKSNSYQKALPKPQIFYCFSVDFGRNFIVLYMSLNNSAQGLHACNWQETLFCNKSNQKIIIISTWVIIYYHHYHYG